MGKVPGWSSTAKRGDRPSTSGDRRGFRHIEMAVCVPNHERVAHLARREIGGDPWSLGNGTSLMPATIGGVSPLGSTDHRIRPLRTSRAEARGAIFLFSSSLSPKASRRRGASNCAGGSNHLCLS